MKSMAGKIIFLPKKLVFKSDLSDPGKTQAKLRTGK
jgi:hypothetical protein